MLSPYLAKTPATVPPCVIAPEGAVFAAACVADETPLSAARARVVGTGGPTSLTAGVTASAAIDFSASRRVSRTTPAFLSSPCR